MRTIALVLLVVSAFMITGCYPPPDRRPDPPPRYIPPPPLR